MNPQVKALKEETKTRAYLQARNELKRDVQKAIENFKNRTGVSVSKIQVIYSPHGTPLTSFWFDI